MVVVLLLTAYLSCTAHVCVQEDDPTPDASSPNSPISPSTARSGALSELSICASSTRGVQLNYIKSVEGPRIIERQADSGWQSNWQRQPCGAQTGTRQNHYTHCNPLPPPQGRVLGSPLTICVALLLDQRGAGRVVQRG
jgi:hypothetical protein